MIRQFAIALATSAALATGVLAEDVQQDQSRQQSQQDQAQQQNPSQQAGAQMGDSEVSDATSQNPDRAFAAVLISHARLQQQISQLVAQKATNPQVKQLAQEIVNDHQQFSQRIQQAAQQAGITIHPERLLPRDRAVLNYMEQLPVSTLERNYVFFEAGSNQTNLLFSQWAANNAQRPQIKQVAQEIATKLQQRSQTIQQLAQAEVSGGAQPAGGQMAPSGQQGGGSSGQQGGSSGGQQGGSSGGQQGY